MAKNNPGPLQLQQAGAVLTPSTRVYFFAPGVALLFFDIDSALLLPVALPCVAALVVELERDARVAPVAGAVFMALPERGPVAGEWLGATKLPLDGGVSAFEVEERCAAEPEPLLDAGVWAEAVAVPMAKAAKTNKLFI